MYGGRRRTGCLRVRADVYMCSTLTIMATTLLLRAPDLLCCLAALLLMQHEYTIVRMVSMLHVVSASCTVSCCSMMYN